LGFGFGDRAPDAELRSAFLAATDAVGLGSGFARATATRATATAGLGAFGAGERRGSGFLSGRDRTRPEDRGRLFAFSSITVGSRSTLRTTPPSRTR